MRDSIYLTGKVVLISWLILGLGGCSVAFYKRSPKDKAKIEELSKQLEQLKVAREQESRELKETMDLLEIRLKKEIEANLVRLEMAEKGLVITFVAEVLFDSGKVEIRSEAFEVLEKLGKVLKTKVPEKNIGIEGHTDDQPIKYSGWKSNWELSTARATSVLHYLVDKSKISPERLQATGFGEYRPVASNATPEGKQKNRRVEIVVLPRITKAQIETLERKLPQPRQRRFK